VTIYELRFTHGLQFVIAGILGVSIEFRRGVIGEVTVLVAHKLAMSATLGNIAENCHGGVAPIDADHAASWMRACSAQVDAWHGRARRKPP
jgi:hypothetical protein